MARKHKRIQYQQLARPLSQDGERITPDKWYSESLQFNPVLRRKVVVVHNDGFQAEKPVIDPELLWGPWFFLRLERFKRPFEIYRYPSFFAENLHEVPVVADDDVPTRNLLGVGL